MVLQICEILLWPQTAGLIPSSGQMLQSYNDGKSLQGIALCCEEREQTKYQPGAYPTWTALLGQMVEKETLSGLNWHLLAERATRSDDHDGLVKAISMTSLYVNSLVTMMWCHPILRYHLTLSEHYK